MDFDPRRLGLFSGSIGMPPKNKRGGGRGGQPGGWPRQQQAFQQPQNTRGSVYSRLGSRPVDRQAFAPVDARQLLIARRQMAQQEEGFHEEEEDAPPVRGLHTRHGRFQNFEMGMELSEFHLFDIHRLQEADQSDAFPFDDFEMDYDGRQQPVSNDMIARDDVRNTVLNKKRRCAENPADLRSYLQRKKESVAQAGTRQEDYPPSFKITLAAAQASSDWHQEASFSPQQTQPQVRSTASFFRQVKPSHPSQSSSSNHQAQRPSPNRQVSPNGSEKTLQIVSPKPKAYVDSSSSNVRQSVVLKKRAISPPRDQPKVVGKKRNVSRERQTIPVREKYSPVSPSCSPSPVMKRLVERHMTQERKKPRMRSPLPALTRHGRRSRSPLSKPSPTRSPDITSRLLAETLDKNQRQRSVGQNGIEVRRERREVTPEQRHRSPVVRERPDREREETVQKERRYEDSRKGKLEQPNGDRRRGDASPPFRRAQRTPERRTPERRMQRVRMENGRQYYRRSPSLKRKSPPQRNTSRNGRYERPSPSRQSYHRSPARRSPSPREGRNSKHLPDRSDVERSRLDRRSIERRTTGRREDYRRKSPPPKRRSMSTERRSKSCSPISDKSVSEMAEASPVDSEEEEGSEVSSEQAERKEGSTISSTDEEEEVSVGHGRRNGGRVERSVDRTRQKSKEEYIRPSKDRFEEEAREQKQRRVEEYAAYLRRQRDRPRSPDRRTTTIQRHDGNVGNGQTAGRNRPPPRYESRSYESSSGKESAAQARSPVVPRNVRDERRRNGGDELDVGAAGSPPVHQPVSVEYPPVYTTVPFLDSTTSALNGNGEGREEEMEEEVLDLTVSRNGRSVEQANGSVQVSTGNGVALRPLSFAQKELVSAPLNLMVERDVGGKIEEGKSIGIVSRTDQVALKLIDIPVRNAVQTEEKKALAIRDAQRQARVKLSSEKIEEVSSRVCAARQGRAELPSTSQGRAENAPVYTKVRPSSSSAAASPVRAVFKMHSSAENSPSKSSSSSGNIVIDGRHLTQLAWILPPSVRVECDYQALVKEQFPEDTRQEDPRWTSSREQRGTDSDRESDKNDGENRKERGGSSGKPKKSEDEAA
ncbi:hypothetical protein RvY_12753 [Ramazzottius varieornatus]|uniref:Uncharacterized protein n=1 Tax=Ramazzottius varieornatus TaxID=947166 RepID=A0A1D1VPP2_RAMVA|nr:hypothetical protein RvY_12753 [Ramazzottius varieornatus]